MPSDKKIPNAGAAQLRARQDAVFLYQQAVVPGVRHARTIRRVCASPVLMPLPSTKFARLRGRLRLYSRARFVLRGLRRRPRFNRVRRIARIYQRRRMRASRKLARAVRRMSSYRWGIRCFKRRAIPTHMLKAVRTGHLTRTRRGVLLQQ